MIIGFKSSCVFKLSLFIFIFVLNLSAQDPKLVIENSIRAMGSAKHLSNIRSIRAIANCTGPRGPYTTEIFSAGNRRLIFRQVRAGSVYKGQTNGQVFWTTDEKTGEFSLADAKAAFAWRSHDFQWMAAEVGERFYDFSFEGEENFAGKPALKLGAKDELGHPAALFFDKDSHLMLGFVIQNPFNDRAELIRNVFNEWRQIGKVKLPSKITVTDKQGDFVLNFHDISLNKVDEGMFVVPRQVTAMAELNELHKKQREDHFNRDAAAMAAGFTDDFTNIANGRITKPTRDESFQRFKNYFGRSTFLEWDDITPPVIRVSSDGTMGHTIVHKRVRLLSKGEDGKETEVTEVYAWVALYRKINGKWLLTAVSSTNTPEEDK
jgi:hypothetical protein